MAEEETLEARLILEPGIITLAAERCSDEDVATLRRMCQDMEAKVRDRDFEGFSVCDLLFHSALANMAGNQALVMLLSTVGDMMLHQQNIVQIIPGAMERAHLFHLDMVEAMATHDSALAGELMHKHLEDVMLTLRVSRTFSSK
ncbi:MAG: FCD domain-containing protein [Planctomycetaceae bacterium]|nr:FCD domain-containing protein [Planctomycetaceae bacterium]